MMKVRSIGISIALAGALVGFFGLLSESGTTAFVGTGLVLLGFLPMVLFPILPKLRNNQAAFRQPAMTGISKRQLNRSDIKDRRTGNPRYN